MQAKQEERTVKTPAAASTPFSFRPPTRVTNVKKAPFMMRVPTEPKADRMPKGPKTMMVPSVAPIMAPVEPKAEKAKRIARARYAERHIQRASLPPPVARRGGSTQVGVGQMQGQSLLEKQRRIMEGKKVELEAKMANVWARSMQEKKLKEKLGHSAKRLEEYAKELAMKVERLEAERMRTGKGKEVVLKLEEVGVGVKREKTAGTSGVEMMVKAAENQDDVQKGTKRSLEEAFEDGELKQEGEVDFYASDRWAMDMLRNERKKTRHEQVLDGPF